MKNNKTGNTNKRIEASIDTDFNPLNFDYARFDEKEIRDNCIRTEINHGLRKLSGIEAIATILHAAAAESNASGTEPLSDVIVCGLADALAELALDGRIQLENVGLGVAALQKKESAK